MAVATYSEIVESPITAAKITAAMDAARVAVDASGPAVITSFNQGRSVIVAMTAPAYS